MTGKPFQLVVRSIYDHPVSGATAAGRFASREAAERRAVEVMAERHIASAWVVDRTGRTACGKVWVRGKPGDGWERLVPTTVWEEGTERPASPELVYVGAAT